MKIDLTHQTNLSIFHDFCYQSVKKSFDQGRFLSTYHSGINICSVYKKNNDQILLYLGAGAGPFIALVAQVQVEEDIAVLNTSKLRYQFMITSMLWFFIAAQETDERKGCWLD